MAIVGAQKVVAAASPYEHYWGSAANEECSRFVERFQDRAVGLIGIHPPDVDGSLRAIEKYHKRGFIGIKLMPTLGYYADDERYRRIFEEANTRKMICLTHCGWCSPVKRGGPDMPQSTRFAHPHYFEPLIRIFPDIDFIFAHGGGRTGFQAAFELVSYHSNAWVDTCTGQGPWVFQHAGPWLNVLDWSRVLYGTDTLYGGDLWSPNFTCETRSLIPNMLKYLGFGDKAEGVMHANAERLLRRHGVSF